MRISHASSSSSFAPLIREGRGFGEKWATSAKGVLRVGRWLLIRKRLSGKRSCWKLSRLDDRVRPTCLPMVSKCNETVGAFILILLFYLGVV